MTPEKREYGSKNCKSGVNMAVTSPGWCPLTICKQLTFCRCRQNIPCDLVEVNKIGIDHLAGAGKMVAMS